MQMPEELEGQQPEIHELPTSWLRLRPWREISALALMMMDINWVLPLFQSLTQTGARQASLFAGLLLGGILLSAYIAARVIFLLRLKTLYRQIILFIGLLSAALLAIKNFLYAGQPMGPSAVLARMATDFADPMVLLPAEVMLVGLTALLWWRGVSLAHRWIGPGTAQRSFRWGTVMLLVVAFTRVESGLESLLPHLALFIFSALVAVGAARAASLRQLRGANQDPLTMNWLAGMLAVAVGVVAIAATIAVFLAGEPSSLISNIVMWVVRLTLAAVLIVISPILIAIIFLFTWFTSFFSDSPVLQAMQDQLVEMVKILVDFFYSVGGFLREIWLALPSIPWAKPVMLWGLILLILIAMFRRFGIKWRLPFNARGESQPGEVEALPGDVMASMRGWLERGIDRLGERLSGLGMGGKLIAAARIRRIYTQLLALSAELGAPRREWQTPLEFMVTLHGLFPNHGDDLVEVTGAYVRVRYGELPELRSDLTRVEKAWKALKEKGRQLKKAKQALDDQSKQEKLRGDFTMRRTQ